MSIVSGEGSKVNSGKRCSHCGQQKPAVEFNRARKSPDGLHCYCRSCQAARAAVWMEQNRETLAEYKHGYYRQNRDSVRARGNRHYRETREQQLQRCRELRQKNPAAVREREVVCHANQTARKRGISSRLSVEEWRSALARFGRRCCACGSGQSLTIDHVVPLSRGGDNTAENIQVLCGSCNSRKGTRTLDYRG